MKHPGNLGHNRNTNLRTVEIEEEDKSFLKVPENIFNKIIEEKFSKLKKGIPTKV